MFLALAIAAAEPEIDLFGPRDFEVIKLSVGAKLKDDASARWKLEQPKDTTTYCGWVNSKNAFGAYAGWEAFVVTYIKFGNEPARVFLGPFFQSDNSGAADSLFATCEATGFNLYSPPAIPDS